MITNSENIENRMARVQKAMFDESFVPKGNSIGLNVLCQLYKIDRVRTFARFPNTDTFALIDDARPGREPGFHAEESGFDFHKSLYQRGNESRKSILPILLETPLIYTTDMSQYEAGLEEINYTKTPGKKVSQAFICTMVSRSTGIMGVLTLEQFEDSEQLSKQELIEIRSICDVVMLRIESDETQKQLRKEEALNDYDDVTGLPILRVFKDEVSRKLKENPMCVMLYLDVDKFKYINDIWDFTIGNQILYEIGGTLNDFLEEGEFCCRINDDKFGIYLKYTDDEELNTRIEVLNNSFIKMQQEHFADIKITIICGIYVTRTTMQLNDIIDKANVARRNVKGSYQNAFEFYDNGLENLSAREKELEKRTQIALEKRQFIPYLQPKFDLVTNKICGAEALARWKTEERMIAPFEFIPIFEKNGFITTLDFEIYDQTLAFIRLCLDKGLGFVPVSLNVSRGHINDENFLTKFMGIVKKYNVPTNLIELELTESIFSEDNEQLKTFISDIRKIGINVSIDDFGSAYSSLTLLKDIDVDTVKLDKAFIDNISKSGSEDSHKDKIIIKNIVRMINELGFKTIFEGIEIAEQADFLKDTGCHYGQGYIFARPISLEEFERKFLL